jgi:hypothetical protein
MTAGNLWPQLTIQSSSSSGSNMVMSGVRVYCQRPLLSPALLMSAHGQQTTT